MPNCKHILKHLNYIIIFTTKNIEINNNNILIYLIHLKNKT